MKRSELLQASRIGNSKMNLMKALMSLLMSVSWLAGIVVAQGWLKLFAILLPPYAWYLIVERLMKVYEIV
jgi:hypothetical protein